MKDDSVFPLAVRRVIFKRRHWHKRSTSAYMVGEHPWAGAGFKLERDAWKYIARLNSSTEPRNETTQR